MIDILITMHLKPEQVARLKRPFNKIGAFSDTEEQEIEKVLNDVMNYYVALANVSLRLKQEEKSNGTQNYGK